MAKAVLYPKKNLVMQMNEVKNISASSKVGEYYFRSTIGSTNYYTVKGEYYLVIVASGNNVDVRVNVPVKPNTKYRPSVETNGDIHLTFLDNNFNQITTFYDTISTNKVATSPVNAAYVMFTLTNRGLGSGTYFFKNWQLEEVQNDTSAATTFEPYKPINKPAALYSKNLIKTFPNADWINRTTNGTTFELENNMIKAVNNVDVPSYMDIIFPAKPNTVYTVLIRRNDDMIKVYSRGSDASYTYLLNEKRSGYFKVTTLANTTHIKVNVEVSAKGTFYFDQLQVQEGDVQTPYELYKLGNKPAVLYPRKNLLDFRKYTVAGLGAIEVENTNDFVRVKTSANATGFVIPIGNLKPNTQYTVSGLVEILKKVDDFLEFRVFNRTKGAYVNFGFGVRATVIGQRTTIGGTFSSGAVDPSDNIEVWITQTWQNGVSDQFEFKLYKDTLQLEEGTTATPYEPYRLGNKKAK